MREKITLIISPSITDGWILSKMPPPSFDYEILLSLSFPLLSLSLFTLNKYFLNTYCVLCESTYVVSSQ